MTKEFSGENGPSTSKEPKKQVKSSAIKTSCGNSDLLGPAKNDDDSGDESDKKNVSTNSLTAL